jgi:tetratricopeptide (TPR) repeat protein
MSRYGFLLGVLLFAVPATAQEMWDRNKGDCEQVFRNWRTSSLPRLRDCVEKWEMYRDVSHLSDDDRAVAQEAFEKLYEEGSERDAVMTLSALKRMGLRPRKLRSESKAVPQDDQPAEPVHVVQPKAAAEPEPAPAEAEAVPASKLKQPDPAASRAHALKGKQLIQAGKLNEGVSELLIAADADPTYADPLYLAATAFVQLGQPDSAIEYLARMKAIDSNRARVLIRQAATDPHFASVRSQPAFKDVTGTAMIQILNGIGAAGNKKVLEFKQRLESVGIPVANVGADLNPRTSTFIYTKPGFERQGEEIRRQLQLGLVHKKPLHWVSEYDVIVVYGEVSKEKWVDDEAEKAGEDAKAKQKAEEEAKKKKEAEKKKQEEEMQKKLQMLKMLQEMDKTDPANVAEPPADAPPVPSAP